MPLETGTDALSTAIKVIFSRLEALERDRTDMARQIMILHDLITKRPTNEDEPPCLPEGLAHET